MIETNFCPFKMHMASIFTFQEFILKQQVHITCVYMCILTENISYINIIQCNNIGVLMLKANGK